jgi:hypothetical protein
LLGALVSEVAFATQGQVSGQIQILRSHNAEVPNDWVQLSGVTTAGNCPPLVSGQPIIFLLTDDVRGNRQFAALLTDKMAGATVTIGFDDTLVSSAGYCYLYFLMP